jgi:hypothetical protein
MELKKLSIKEAVKHKALRTFEGADIQAQEHKELKSIKDTTEARKTGRPLKGKSKATNKVYFVVDDEQLEYLESLIDYKRKLTSPSAVCKMLFVRDYELHKKD